MNKRVRLAGVCVIITTAVTLVVLVPGVSGQGGQGRASAARGRTWTGLMQRMGIYFRPAPDSGVEQPLLPNGQKAITRTAAVDAALGKTPAARDGKLLPDVQVQAQFGLFSDDQLSRKSQSASFEPLLQNRPVWLLTFSGSGVVIMEMGNPRMRSRGIKPRVNHEDNVVIDAQTGQYLESFTFR